jgi:hypothetical protein
LVSRWQTRASLRVADLALPECSTESDDYDLNKQLNLTSQQPRCCAGSCVGRLLELRR